MPKFSEAPLTSDEDVENWLRFYEMDAPFMNLSVFVSRDPVIDFKSNLFIILFNKKRKRGATFLNQPKQYLLNF